jgi:hypothetical protein
MVGTVTAAVPTQATPVPTCTPVAVDETDQVLTFTNPASCLWTVPNGVHAADVLVVAGGGAGPADQFKGPGGVRRHDYPVCEIGGVQLQPWSIFR